MAKVPCKHLVLVALFLLCFVSIGARARSLRVASNNNQVEMKHQDLSTPKENEVQEAPVPVPEAEELVGMDYTAPRKKPPIHN
ncbi:protein GOLVEN 1-like [Ricinus communis]|uniref:protein GOLVEN 1-like n=1 Tax=Ricinus communis TaxID=3988 RepID=UPI000D689112|nr:protein GOLVEN 1-like [Ricinus communis]|eukprot:XP_025015512.1 root meristem growth factor 6-like [Ricinus communis]